MTLVAEDEPRAPRRLPYRVAIREGYPRSASGDPEMSMDGQTPQLQARVILGPGQQPAGFYQHRKYSSRQ